MIDRALNNIRPGSKWVIIGDSYEGLQWLDENITKPTEEEINLEISNILSTEPMRLLRIERDKRLSATDWWVLPDRSPTPEQISYRQALRDITVNSNPMLDENNRLDMNSVNWPVKP